MKLSTIDNKTDTTIATLSTLSFKQRKYFNKQTQASIKGLGAALWQKQEEGISKPIRCACLLFIDTETKYAVNKLHLLE